MRMWELGSVIWKWIRSSAGDDEDFISFYPSTPSLSLFSADEDETRSFFLPIFLCPQLASGLLLAFS